MSAKKPKSYKKSTTLKNPYHLNAPWPSMRGDVKNSGRLKDLIWKNPGITPRVTYFRTENAIFSTPIIDAEERVFVGSADHKFYSFDPHEGVEIWEHELSEIIDSAGCVDEDGTIYVADWGNNRVQILSSDGTPLRTFGTRGIAPGCLRGPTGICLEEGGYLLVVDSQNDRVQRYRRDGRLVSVLPEAKGMGAFTKPFSAALDPSGVVYVTERDRHGILVLQQVWEEEYLSDLSFTNLGE